MGDEGGDTQLVVVNPTFIAGPSLVAALRSTLTAFKAIIEGTMPALPRQRFGVVDVRDVAEAHITAMATPSAAGKRFLLLADGPTITWLGLAQILRDYLGPAGGHVTTDEAPGEDPSPLTIHNDRAKQELGWQLRPAEITIVETADSLYELGLLGNADQAQQTGSRSDSTELRECRELRTLTKGDAELGIDGDEVAPPGECGRAVVCGIRRRGGL